MDNAPLPRPFFVLESAPTSEDEFSAICIGENYQPIADKKPYQKPAEFEERETKIQHSAKASDFRPKRPRTTEEEMESLQKIFEESDLPVKAKPHPLPKKSKPFTVSSSVRKPAISNVETLKLELDSLEASFQLETIADLLTCRLCGGLMRHPQCMLECMHTFCKVCVFSWMATCSKLNKCPQCDQDVTASTPNLLLESVIAKLISTHSTETSQRLPMALKVLSSIGLCGKEKSAQMQTVLMGAEETVTFSVTDEENAVMAWEVPVEFTVADAKELVLWKCRKHGELRCRGVRLADELMLGFVFLYLWRKQELMELEVTQ